MELLSRFTGDDEPDDEQNRNNSDEVGGAVDDLEELNKELIATRDMEVPQRALLGIRDTWARPLIGTSFPEEPPIEYLDKPLNYPETRNDVSVHVRPIDTQDAIEELRKAIKRISIDVGEESDFLSARENKDRLETVEKMLEHLRKEDQTGLSDISLTATVRGQTREEVREADNTLRTKFLEAPNRTELSHAVAEDTGTYLATSPLALDSLKDDDGIRHSRKAMNGAVSSLFQFGTKKYIDDEGVEFGLQRSTGSPVIVDRWGLENGYNQVTVAKIGSGKSYSTKLNILRTYAAHDDVLVFVMDPLGGYENVTNHLNGNIVRIGGGQQFNPMEIQSPEDIENLESEARPFNLKRDSVKSFIKTFFSVYDKDAGEEMEAISEAIDTAYRRNGIQSDPRTHGNESPTLTDVREILADMAQNPSEYTGDIDTEYADEQMGKRAEIAYKKLQEFSDGRELDNLAKKSANNSIQRGDVVYIDMEDLSESRKGLMMPVIFEQIYQRAKSTDKKVLLCIEEAHNIFRHTASLDFLEEAVRHSRHYDLSINFISQTISEFLANEKAKNIMKQISIKLFHRQPETSAEAARQVGLTDEEIQYVRTMKAGDEDLGYSEGLLAVNDEKIPLRVMSDGDLEHMLVKHSSNEIAQRL